MTLYRCKTKVVEARQVTEPEHFGNLRLAVGDWVLIDPTNKPMLASALTDCRFQVLYEPLLLSWWPGLWQIWASITKPIVPEPVYGEDCVTEAWRCINHACWDETQSHDPREAAAIWWCHESTPADRVYALSMLLRLEAIPPEEREAAIRRGEIFA